MSDNFIQENSEIITLRAMANVFMPEALDPVGQEDDDVDNDGDSDKSDEYLKKRRKAVGSAIDKRKKKLKEATADAHTSDDDDEEIVEKKVKNKVTINPQMESKGYYDPMEDDEFDHDEAEKNRGVSGKNNPKGGKRLYKKPKRKSVEEAVNTPTSDYNRAKQLNSPASPTGGQRPPGSMDPRNKPGIDSLTGVKQASAGTGPKLKPGSGLGGGKPVYPKGQEPKPTGAQLPKLQTAGYEPEGDQLQENPLAIGAALGIGAGGLALMNKLRQQKKASDQGQGDGGLVDRINKRNQQLNQLNQETEIEGGEQLNERPYQVMGYDKEGKKEKKVGKPVKSRKYADARAAELSDTHKKTGGKYRSQYVEDVENVEERYKGSKHRPPAGWKPYGGYEKGPVEVDATAKRIDAIRKSIKTKKKKED